MLEGTLIKYLTKGIKGYVTRVISAHIFVAKVENGDEVYLRTRERYETWDFDE